MEFLPEEEERREKEKHVNHSLHPDTSDTQKIPAEETNNNVSKERGETTAENIRYGEAISEHGFGGETVGNSGEADNQEGGGGSYGRVGETEKMRREQGYGGGSGVGA